MHLLKGLPFLFLAFVGSVQAGKCAPSCSAGLTKCSGTCVNLNLDPNNCGECGVVCASGTCENGACSAPSCQGQTCDTFGPCGAGGSCVCASITDGTGFCADGQTPCSGLADCNTSADCPSGNVCAVNTCCGRNVCIGATFCGVQNTPKMLFERELVEATIGHRAYDNGQ